MTSLAPRDRLLALLALLILVPAPTLGVLAAMWWEPTRGTPTGQAIYFLGKIWILALPLFWQLVFERERIRISKPNAQGLKFGAALGILIASSIIGGYWFVGRHLIDAPAMRTALAANGLDEPMRYLALALMLTFGNALLEEYVWRWFVYRQCENVSPRSNAWIAVVLSALCFTLHHLVALRLQMDWAPALLASAGIFIGGCVWSALYRRYRSIWPGYVSHIFADIAVFMVGWWVLFG